MLRKTLTILSLLGLLLSAGLWMASYAYLGYAFGSTGHATSGIYLHQGCVVMIKYKESTGPQRLGFHSRGFYGFRTAWIPWIEIHPLSQGKVTAHRFFYATSGYWWIGIPHWIPTSVCAVTYLVSHPPTSRRRNRRKLGLCVKCGYNLRGLTEPRCPECNTSFDERLLKKDA